MRTGMITLKERPTYQYHTPEVNPKRELSFLKQVLVQRLGVCAGLFSSWKDGSMSGSLGFDHQNVERGV